MYNILTVKCWNSQPKTYLATMNPRQINRTSPKRNSWHDWDVRKFTPRYKLQYRCDRGSCGLSLPDARNILPSGFGLWLVEGCLSLRACIFHTVPRLTVNYGQATIIQLCRSALFGHTDCLPPGTQICDGKLAGSRPASNFTLHDPACQFNDPVSCAAKMTDVREFALFLRVFRIRGKYVKP